MQNNEYLKIYGLETIWNEFGECRCESDKSQSCIFFWFFDKQSVYNVRTFAAQLNPLTCIIIWRRTLYLSIECGHFDKIKKNLFVWKL